jgi:tetratricopeptide (TPR) repeat protein
MIRTAVCVLSCAWLPAAPAQAAAPLKRVVAQRHFELGQSLYKTSNYPAALSEFQKALALDPNADLVFNIARCYEVMGKLELAIATYRDYLARKPNASDRDLVETRIATLEQRARDDGIAVREPPPPEDTAPRRRWRRTAGWTAIGVGVAALGAGIAFGALARSKASDYQQAVDVGKTWFELEEIAASGRRHQAAQIATLVVGGAATAGGVVLLVLDWRRPREARAARPTVMPFVSAAGGGLLAGGSF